MVRMWWAGTGIHHLAAPKTGLVRPFPVLVQPIWSGLPLSSVPPCPQCLGTGFRSHPGAPRRMRTNRGIRGGQKDLKHEKDQTCHCWFADEGDREPGNVSGFQKLRTTPGWQLGRKGDLSPRATWRQILLLNESRCYLPESL